MVSLTQVPQIAASLLLACVVSGCANPSQPRPHARMDDFCSEIQVDEAQTCVAPMLVIALQPGFFHGRRIVTSGVLANVDNDWIVFPDFPQAKSGFLATSLSLNRSSCIEQIESAGLVAEDALVIEISGWVQHANGSGRFRMAGMPKLEFEAVESLRVFRSQEYAAGGEEICNERQD